MSLIEMTIGRERDAEGNMLVKLGDQCCGTLEEFKRFIDRTYQDEVLRKLAEAGVQFSMTDGVPKISVPASAAHMVEIEGAHAGKLDASTAETIIKAASGQIPGVKLAWEDGKPNWTIWADQFVRHDPIPASPVYDPRKDPNFASAVEAATRDSQKRRSL